MSVIITLKVEGASLTAGQVEAVRAHAQLVFGCQVDIVKPIAVKEEVKQEEAEPESNSLAPYWDDEIQGWVDPISGNWLVNYG